jgi:hypothetical protein
MIKLKIFLVWQKKLLLFRNMFSIFKFRKSIFLFFLKKKKKVILKFFYLTNSFLLSIIFDVLKVHFKRLNTISNKILVLE